MNILNVNMSLDPVGGGGTAERTLQISRSLVRAGHYCTILTTDGGLSPDYLRQCQASGLNVVALPTIWKRFYLPRPSRVPIRNLVAQADMIHLMTHWTLINALVYKNAKDLAKPYVVCPAGALPIFGRSRVLKSCYNHWIGRDIIRHASHCIAVSGNEIEHFKSYGVQQENISVIPNGISPDDFTTSDGLRFRARYGLGDAPLILYMGRLNPIKGPDLLLQAFCSVGRNRTLETHHLVFAGSDEGMLGQLKSMAQDSGLGGRVHFVGHIVREEKSDAYRAADFLAIPSRQEAMSIVVLEAGILGTPVLITDKCGFDDVADVSGGMVVEASVEGLKKGLLFMAGATTPLKLMGRRLETLVRERYLWDHIVNKYLELFQKIVH